MQHGEPAAVDPSIPDLSSADPSSADQTSPDPSSQSPAEVSARRGTALFVVVVALVAVAAAFQNFFRLSAAPILSDEPLYSSTAWKYLHWSKQPLVIRTRLYGNNFEHPPLGKFLMGVAQLVVGHPSLTASRCAAAVATLVTALLLGGWLGHVAGRWTGLLAGGAFALIPMSVSPQVTRFGRTAMLDNMAEPFMMASVVLTWYWFRSAGWRRWVLAVATGVMVGLATACKENGFLGAVGPIALGVILTAAGSGAVSAVSAQAGRGRSLVVTLVQAGLTVVISIGVFLGCYLPFGQPVARARYVFDFQARHSVGGHLEGLDGMVTLHPPWWANLWFARVGLGNWLALTLGVMVLVALALRRDQIVWWCAAAVVAPFVFHSFISGVSLPYYWVMWMPCVVGMAALGITFLAGVARRQLASPPAAPAASAAPRARAGGRAGMTARPVLRTLVGVVAAAVAVVALCAVLLPAASETVRVAQLQPIGAAIVPSLRGSLGLHGTVITTGNPGEELEPLLHAHMVSTLPTDLAAVDTVIVGRDRCRVDWDRGVLAMVKVNVAAGALRLAHADRLMDVYVRTGPLQQPTPADIAQAPHLTTVSYC